MIEKKIIEQYLKKLNLRYDKDKIAKIIFFLTLIYENNKYFNLVGTKDINDILTRHFFDCLSIFEVFNKFITYNLENKKILDVGTGAGLPGILLAIFLEKSFVYLLDSRKKISTFLNTTKNKLKLENVKILVGRAEDLSHYANFRESFDIVVSRAVANVKTLSELTIPFCKVGGFVFMYKSKKIIAELKFAENIIQKVGGNVVSIFEVKIPNLNEYRAFLIIKKDRNTLYNYPRKYAKIKKGL